MPGPFLYTFRWKCDALGVTIAVHVYAHTDREAGEKAALAVFDKSRGRLAEYQWVPAPPLIEQAQ